MILRKPLASLFLLALVSPAFSARPLLAQEAAQPAVLGYPNFTAEARIEERFLAVPSARLAGEELKTLTREPHVASTPEDYKTAEYVARKFRAAGLETEIVPYRVLIDLPRTVRVQAYGPGGKLLMSGPTREHVQGDPYQDDPRVVMPYNSSSGSGDVTAAVVYANYGRLEDFDQLAARHIDLRGKIVLCRYGGNFRGVKVYIAEQRGAAGVLLYSDPQDDGYVQGDAYPLGPWRPETGVQRGSVQYLFKYPGDPETPGVASTVDLPDSARNKSAEGPYGNQPHIISIPLSYHDAAPILKALAGPGAPQGWQGGLPFRYHIGEVGGSGAVQVHLVSVQDDQRRIIWDVIGKVRGSEYPDEWVVAGNHRDAWAYGAVDPNSGTAALLEAVHGIGALLGQGWRPRRTIVFCSWDAEEEGLIGSTEWVEQNAKALQHAVAYFNTDVAVSGPDFSASSVPSLRQFVAGVTRSVPSPLGGTVYEQWSIEHRQRTITPACRCRWAIWAPAPISRPSSSTPACPRPISAPKAPTAFITPSSTTTPGMSRTPTRISFICSRWLASWALNPCAWPTPRCSPTTTSLTPVRSARISMLPNGRRASREFLSIFPPPKLPMPGFPPRRSEFTGWKSPPPDIWPRSIWPRLIWPCTRPKAISSLRPACPTVPGTGTPSMPPASTPVMQRW